MYEAFYQLREKPFSILPDPDMIYWGKMHSMAFTMLEFGVMNNAGFTVITGEIGSGKTTLVRALLKKVNPNITIGLISNSPQGRQELLQWILMSLNQPFEGDYPNLFKRLQDFLHGQFANGRRTILIIDEAQNLEPEALEHLRMISNINADKFQILQLILVGQPQLRDLLVGPKLHQFAQRISSDFHLRPLDPREVANYIAFRLKVVGASRPLFTQEACTLIGTASGGIPRMINVLCDTALVYGFANDQRVISDQIVRDVIADKQQYSIFPVKKFSAVP
jgi:type II secretory pathway predicted ATPase ExeA